MWINFALQKTETDSGYSIRQSAFSSNSLDLDGHQKSRSVHQLEFYGDLVGHINTVSAMEFSEDGSLLVSGGVDKSVRLWSIGIQTLDDDQPSKKMEKNHSAVVLCLAVSSDNRRIFSGGMDSFVFIHDTQK